MVVLSLRHSSWDCFPLLDGVRACCSGRHHNPTMFYGDGWRLFFFLGIPLGDKMETPYHVWDCVDGEGTKPTSSTNVHTYYSSRPEHQSAHNPKQAAARFCVDRLSGEWFVYMSSTTCSVRLHIVIETGAIDPFASANGVGARELNNARRKRRIN